MPTDPKVRASRDFGAVRRYGVAHVIGTVAVIAAGTAYFSIDYLRTRDAHVATAKAWDIKGPPCPQLTAAEWTAQRQIAPKTFDYDGTTLGRVAGDASCSDVKADGGTSVLVTDKVCQFTSPAALTVTSPAGTFYYAPGAGQPATIHIHKDRPACVMASKFTLQSE